MIRKTLRLSSDSSVSSMMTKKKRSPATTWRTAQMVGVLFGVTRSSLLLVVSISIVLSSFFRHRRRALFGAVGGVRSL